MPTPSFSQGSLRPTRTPAITVVHPGLQVHSIAAPKTDRRLSFLMSANLYCAFAAGAVLVAQAAPAIIRPIITERPPAIIDLVSPGVTPLHLAAMAPPVISNLLSHPADTPAIPEPGPIAAPETTPTSIGEHDLSSQIAASAASTNGSDPHGKDPKGLPSGTPSGLPAGQPVEVSASAVSILHQIQPTYPSLARLAHKEGDVVLIMTINEQGVPTEVKLDSGDAIFRNDAIRAAQQWRFTPARFDGQPHSARFRLTLQFRLHG